MPEVAFVSPIASAVVTLLLIAWMLRAGGRVPLDVPNQRSLHLRPVPRSGGMAMMAGIFAGFALMQTPLVVVLPAAALAALSYVDDTRGVPVVVRLALQLVAASALAYASLRFDPPFVALSVLAILWAMNLYNFMDGSDGLAGGMTLLGFSVLGIGAWMSGDEALLVDCAIVAAAAAAFLLFNFPPARLFMGDAGSVPIGFLAGGISLLGFRDGDWPLWFPVVVFAPFVADATLTLLKRILAGERVWQAHNKHYYQRLVRMGWSHRGTAVAEYALMLACGLIALWALRQPASLQLAAGVGVVAVHAALACWVEVAWRRREGSSH